jgi:hypothetical protein
VDSIACVPLQLVEATHVRITCDGCRVTAELCGKRELPAAAKAVAAQRFRGLGWHQDPSTHRDREYAMALRDGSGRWYCPACARKTHL